MSDWIVGRGITSENRDTEPRGADKARKGYSQSRGESRSESRCSVKEKDVLAGMEAVFV